MNVINASTRLGGQMYPRLSILGDWAITSYKLGNDEDMKALTFTLGTGLAWAKDDQVNVLTAPDMSAEVIMNQLGLSISYLKGAAVASKRMSRLFRPYRYGYEGAVNLIEDPKLDADVWDGLFQVSREFVMRHTQYLNGVTRKSYRRFMNELETCQRWEITIINEQGQYKGHAIVNEDLDAQGIDVLAPVGVAKHELKFIDGSTFSGLNAVHASKSMKLDIQSLINLLPFFGTDNLLKWLKENTLDVLNAIYSGDTKLANMLFALESAEAIDKLEQWPAGAYIVSGGDVRWFSRSVRTAADQYKEMLRSNTEQVRFPVPGGGAYIAPASVGKRDVLPGRVLLDFETASIYVADSDWADYAARNGGFDGDDRHWVVTFMDKADGKMKLLFWRSPNQFGEYLLAEPMNSSDLTSWIDGTVPTMDSTDLPLPIEQQGNKYGTITPISNPAMYAEQYNTQALWLTIEQLKKNIGVLGSFCNVLMCYAAVFNRSALNYPAKLEDVIDFTVKEVGDLSAVRGWIQAHGKYLSKYPIPEVLAGRLKNYATDDIVNTHDHRLDILMNAMTMTMAWFEERTNLIAAQAMPPLSLFELGREHMLSADKLRSIYGRHLRAVIELRVPTAQDMLAAQALVLDAWKDVADKNSTIYGLVANIYTRGENRDGILWNALGPEFLRALRYAGLIGDIEWDDERSAELMYNNPELDIIQPTNVYLKGIWYNLYVAETKQKPAMGKIHKTAQKLYKDKARAIIPFMLDKTLVVADSPESDGRKIVLGPKGNLMAYVAKDQENRTPNGAYKMVSAIENDGNYHAALVRV